ncbi:MAG: 50S ribosomal protein L18 [bacterium]|nr:50S ribosomal protein L18 [bacterium]MDZ4285210.1 50S ribosomal protein L18 [Patescibacteria group bacterium]
MRPTKQTQRIRRHKRIRAKVRGTSVRPRLAVYKSNRYLHVQLVDDRTAKTIVGIMSRGIGSGSKVERSRVAGEQLAKAARAKGIERVVFDRGGFSFRGRIAACAEGARSGGLVF